MLYWALAILTWLIVATLGHMYFIPFSMRFDWDRGMTRFFVAIWPVGLPLLVTGAAIYYLLTGLEILYKKTWGRIADDRLQKLEQEKERIAHEFFLKKQAEREAEDLARKEARKAARAKDQDEPQPVFRQPPKPTKCCAACHTNEEHWRKEPLVYITDDERKTAATAEKEAEAENEAEAEEELKTSTHVVAESVVC